jgi:hypothetical protein
VGASATGKVISISCPSPQLWRLEVAATWIHDNHNAWFSVAGIPLVAVPGIACGFAF